MLFFLVQLESVFYIFNGNFIMNNRENSIKAMRNETTIDYQKMPLHNERACCTTIVKKAGIGQVAKIN
jgi:hypothetical protein